MGKVAGMPPRFLGLRLAVREQLVDLVDQRLDLPREASATRVWVPPRIAATSRRTRRSGHSP